MVATSTNAAALGSGAQDAVSTRGADINGEMRGRVALVTGAAGGMGSAITARLIAAGMRVAVNDLTVERLSALDTGCAGDSAAVLPIAADVTREADVGYLISEVTSQLGPVDVLINNAGVLRPTPFLDITETEWSFVVDVSLKGTFLCSRAVLPSMKARRWGRIVNLSSTAGKSVSTVGGAHYTAAKAAVLGLTRHLAREVAAYGITVNAVCPGLIDTEMVRATISPERVAEYARSFPIPRLGRSEEVADLVAFLASSQAAYITGASVDINGGDLTT